MTQQNHNDVRTLAELAGIPVPPERLPALAAALEITRRIAATLAAVDYGEAEPAPRFRPPASR